MSRSIHLADTIMMVRPYDFEFNEQTGLDNEFQNRSIGDPQIINRRAIQEFDRMVYQLREQGIEIVVLEKSNQPNRIKTPDAVFPNNWFSTERDGTILLYPMLAENRRAEKRIRDVEQLLIENQRRIKNVINVGRPNEDKLILEGTGVLIIDHNNRNIYAAISQRCHPDQLQNFMELRNYNNAILFHTKSSNGKPIYHTNVMMSIADKFAVVCLESIYDQSERQNLISTLGKTHEIIDISIKQMERNFCGNILQVQNKEGQAITVMSQSAFEGFTDKQFAQMEKYGKILNVNINTIERVGGGSARCMMAEVFLPQC